MSVVTDTISANNQPTPDIILRVREAQVRQTYSQMLLGVITNPIAALGMLVVLWPVIPHNRLLMWFSVLLLLQATRIVIAFRYRTGTPTADSALIWGRIQSIINALSGLVWGVAFFSLWPAGLPEYQLILPLIVIGLGAGATAGFAPVRASHLLFILFSLVPLTIRFFAEGTTIYVTLGLLTIMYIASLYRIGHNLHHASTDELTTSIRNQELATILAEEKAKIEALNAQLQESEERFRGLSEATFEGIAIHEDGIAVDFNRAATRMFGYTEEEAIGMQVFDLLQPESRGIAIQNMQTGYEKPYEVQGIRKDGTIFPLEIQGKTVPYKGKLGRVVAVRDITRRKETEAQAMRLQLEQERIQILTSFLRDASHEFRTPLAVIKMSTFLADHADDSAKRQENLDKVNAQTERITDLVDGLLLMVRLDSNIELALMPVDVNHLLRSVAVTLPNDFPEKQLNLTYELVDSLPKIQADSGLLRQAFSALLHNAGRSVSDSGSITLTTSPHEGQLQIIIQDDGMGIDEEALPHIFDRFYRVDKAHSTAGFGLGLAIARQIIMLHEGDIVAESQPGEGATFTVTLPIEHRPGEDEVVV